MASWTPVSRGSASWVSVSSNTTNWSKGGVEDYYLVDYIVEGYFVRTSDDPVTTWTHIPHSVTSTAVSVSSTTTSTVAVNPHLAFNNSINSQYLNIPGLS